MTARSPTMVSAKITAITLEKSDGIKIGSLIF
jgi:hypothetical protein